MTYRQYLSRMHTGKKVLGLGLALVRITLEAHRGTISVSETPGGGATFVIVFPPPPSFVPAS